MIPRLNRWQNHYGAVHRKKIDTPSLVGSCWVSQGTQELPAEFIRDSANAETYEFPFLEQKWW